MQDAGTPILGYAPPKEGLALEEEVGRAMVKFPVAPKWAYALSIASNLVLCLANIVLMALMFRLLFRFRVPLQGSLILVMIPWAFGALLWGCVGLYAWFMYRRWGRVPRTLTADETGLTLSWLGWWWMRERRWPVEEVTALELRVVKCHLIKGHWNPWRTVAVLHVRPQKGRSRWFRLSSADPELPGRIAQRFSEILGRPVICQS